MTTLECELLAAPGENPVSLESLKWFVSVYDDSQDAKLSMYIKLAVARIDGPKKTHKIAIINQEWKQKFCSFQKLKLPLAPVTDILEIKYFDEADEEQTIAPGNYQLLNFLEGPVVVAVGDYQWPTHSIRYDAISVSFRAGFGATEAEVPQDIKNAIYLLVDDMIQNGAPESDNYLPPAVMQQLSGYKRSFI